MKVINYHPRYLKAILDRVRLDVPTEAKVACVALEACIRKRPELTSLVISDKGKFAGFISFAQVDEDLFCLHWSSKDRPHGECLLRHTMRELKGVTVYYTRGTKVERKVI